MNSKRKILVTGGSGFIGTNLINYFINEGYDVLNIDKNEPLDNTKASIWKQVDINDKQEFEEAVISYNPEYIVHLAARCDLDGSTLDDYKANINGMENMMAICKNNCLCLKKIVITSTMLVCKPGYKPKDQLDYQPHTPYGESKVLTEKIAWESNLDLDWAIVRPTSIWGSWFGEPYRNFFDTVINKHYVHVGHKSATMTYGYIENSVAQIVGILFADTTNSHNKVFYLGDYEPTKLEDWANEIASQLHIKIIRVPYFIVKLGAILGDFLSLFRIKFPLTTFRLKNMTTDNIVNLNETKYIVPELPVKRIDGIKNTLKWMGYEV